MNVHLESRVYSPKIVILPLVRFEKIFKLCSHLTAQREPRKTIFKPCREVEYNEYLGRRICSYSVEQKTVE